MLFLSEKFDAKYNCSFSTNCNNNYIVTIDISDKYYYYVTYKQLCLYIIEIWGIIFLCLYLKYFLKVFDILKYFVVLGHVKDAYMPFTYHNSIHLTNYMKWRKVLQFKKTYMLNYKSIHSHSIERQNVKLALRIVHVNNAATLRIWVLSMYYVTLSNWQGTALFIDYILKFWNIFSVKTTVEGIHKRLPDCDPIRSMNSHQMIWMAKFVSWLQSWKLYSMNHPKSFLINETFIAFSHTVKTVLVMMHDLLQHHNLKYILLSKFQTDNLEGRFGLYRQLSGCNYLVSVKDVMYNERKPKIKGLLRLFSASKGVLTVSDFIASFNDIKTNKQDSSFIEYFPYCDMGTEIKDVSELLMVTGFVAKRTLTHLICITCKSKLGYVGKLID